MRMAEWTRKNPCRRWLEEFMEKFARYCSRIRSPFTVPANWDFIMTANLKKGRLVEACQQAMNLWRSFCEHEDWENPQRMLYTAEAGESTVRLKVKDWGWTILGAIEKAAVACQYPMAESGPLDPFFELAKALECAMTVTDRTNEQNTDHCALSQTLMNHPDLVVKARNKFEEIFRSLVVKMVSNVSWISQIGLLACCGETGNFRLTDEQDTCGPCTTLETRRTQSATTMGSWFRSRSGRDLTRISYHSSAPLLQTTFESDQYGSVSTLNLTSRIASHIDLNLSSSLRDLSICLVNNKFARVSTFMSYSRLIFTIG